MEDVLLIQQDFRCCHKHPASPFFQGTNSAHLREFSVIRTCRVAERETASAIISKVSGAEHPFVKIQRH